MRKADLKTGQAYLVDMDAEKDYGNFHFEFVLIDKDAPAMDAAVWRWHRANGRTRSYYSKRPNNQQVAGMIRRIRIDKREGKVTRYENQEWSPAYVRTRRIVDELDIEKLVAETKATSERWANSRAEQALAEQLRRERAEALVGALTAWGFTDEEGNPTYFARNGEIRYRSEWGDKVRFEQVEQILRVLERVGT